MYVSIFPAREFGASFNLSLNPFCLKQHLLKECLCLERDGKAQDREQRSRICQTRGFFNILKFKRNDADGLKYWVEP